jgi:hypothetical protein
MRSQDELLSASAAPAQMKLASPKPRALEFLAVCAVLWTVAAVLQWTAGAFRVEFGSHPDESAHYVTGLMIRDYIASGHFAPPLAYAEHYYAHYPKVAIGMWPPLFHVAEALWTLLFSPAKASVLLFVALITAVTGASIYGVLLADYPWPAAFAGGLLYVLLPLVQSSTLAVMADGMVALLDFWAMIYFVRYLKSERTRDAILFGIFTALSMSTKANGVALILLPVFALLITRRFHLLRMRGLYYAAAIILLIGFPWQVISYRLIQRSSGIPPMTPAEVLRTALFYVGVLLKPLGWGLAPFCILGLIIFVAQLRRSPDLTLAGALSLLLSVWVYHSLIGSGEARYMLGAVPAAILFLVAGFVWVVRRIPLPRVPLVARAAVLGGLAATLFARTWFVPRKPYEGFDQAARFLLAAPGLAGGDYLVISNARGEGAFISEVAMHDDRPDCVILRSTKVLSSQTWYGTIYQLRYKSTREIRDFLDNAPINAVLLDRRPAHAWQDQAAFQLARKVAVAFQSDSHWEFRARFPKLPNAEPWIDLYTRVGPEPSGQVRLDLRYTLGKEIVHTNCRRAKPGAPR